VLEKGGICVFPLHNDKGGREGHEYSNCFQNDERKCALLNFTNNLHVIQFPQTTTSWYDTFGTNQFINTTTVKAKHNSV
jgi:hypothetical protein